MLLILNQGQNKLNTKRFRLSIIKEIVKKSTKKIRKNKIRLKKV